MYYYWRNCTGVDDVSGYMEGRRGLREKVLRAAAATEAATGRASVSVEADTPALGAGALIAVNAAGAAGAYERRFIDSPRELADALAADEAAAAAANAQHGAAAAAPDEPAAAKAFTERGLQKLLAGWGRLTVGRGEWGGRDIDFFLLATLQSAYRGRGRRVVVLEQDCDGQVHPTANVYSDSWPEEGPGGGRNGEEEPNSAVTQQQGTKAAKERRARRLAYVNEIAAAPQVVQRMKQRLAIAGGTLAPDPQSDIVLMRLNGDHFWRLLPKA